MTDVQRAWTDHGLGYWTARTLDGAFVGIGGCALRFGMVWNIYDRLTPAAWGHGYAGEIAAAARSAAGIVNSQIPVVAYLLEHNVASKRTAERTDLTLAWSGPDFGNPDPTAVRLLYSDRPLDEDLVAQLASRP